MGYRSNIGCLWLLLLIALLGGTPLLIGVLRVFLGFVLFAIAGGLLLSWWLRRQAVVGYTRTRSEETKRFVEHLVLLLVRLATLDGTLDRREVTAIRHFFQRDLGYHDEQLLWVRDLIKAAQGNTESVASICAVLRDGYGLQARLIVLQVLGRVAEADGNASAEEIRFIEEVAGELGLTPFLRGFHFEYGPAGGAGGPGRAGPSLDTRVDEALGVLGLQRGASADEIKSAWRQLSLENHPDRVTHLGEEFRRLADERMREINAAYETLKEAGIAS